MKILKCFKKRDYIVIACMVVCVLVDVYFELKMPEYTKKLATILQVGSAHANEVITNGLLMLGCALCSVAFATLTHILVSRLSSSYGMSLRSALFNKILSYSQKDINKFSTSSLITRSTNDVAFAQMFLTTGLQMMIKAPAMAIWAIIKISNSDIRWTYATIICVVLIMVSIGFTAIICFPKFKVVQKLTDKLNGNLRENISGVRVIRAFNAEDYQTEKFEKTNKDIFKNHVFTSRVLALIMPILTIAMNALTLSIYWIGALIINTIALDPNNMSASILERATVVGNMSAFSSYALQVVMSFMLLSVTFIILPRVLVSINRINEILNTDTSIVDGNVDEGNSLTGTIEFKDVCFSYNFEDHNVIENINLKIEKGETVAIIGATGSGKTTLINMIPRFYDVSKGEVLVDGVNVKDYKKEALQSKIAVAFQKAALFKGSIFDNVTYGSKIKDEEKVKKALDIACADFVYELENGLEHEVSQGATNLSGGQKQRISIARALYKDSEIVIFDDTFSALDYKTDAKVRKGIRENLKDTTVIIVAQRIGTIRNADKIVVIDDGKIVGVGKHDQLLNTCEVYKEIALSQLSKEEL